MSYTFHAENEKEREEGWEGEDGEKRWRRRDKMITETER